MLHPDYACKADPYLAISKEVLTKRAKAIKANKDFCGRITLALAEIAQEKRDAGDQSDVTPEESIYLKFVDNKETPKMEKWHQSSWEEKFKLLEKFEDERLVDFGKKIIYQEAPQILPPDLYKNIKSEIARRILSKNKEKWQTIGMAYNEIDILRDQADNKDDEEELKKLDEINEFVMSIEKKYEIG